MDIICLRLAKAGYAGGNPEAVGKMSADWVMKMVDYEGFCSDYEDELYKLNKDHG